MSPTPEAPKTTIDSDAVARAATQRAEKLEKQNNELKAKLEARESKAPSNAEIVELRAEVARMRAEREEFRAAMEAGAEKARAMTRSPEPLAAEHKGTKSYRSNQPHYRQGRFYMPGEIITVTDEKPSKHWRLVEQRAVPTEFVDVKPAESEKPSTPEV